MKKVYWAPWIEETKQVINKSCRYLFAALILTLLVLANIAAVLTILSFLKSLVQGA